MPDTGSLIYENIEEIFIYYDGPLIWTYRDGNGARRIAHWCDMENEKIQSGDTEGLVLTFYYMTFPLPDEIYNRLTTNKVTFREIYEPALNEAELEIHCTLVSSGKEGQNYREPVIRKLTKEELDKYGPVAGVKLRPDEDARNIVPKK